MRIIAAVVLALLGVATSVAFAAAPSSSVHWSELTLNGTRQSQQLGLLRSGGVLHVVSAQGAPATIIDTQLNDNGVTLKTSTVASNFDSAGGVGLVGMADGSTRLFLSGGVRPNLPSNLSGINSFVSTPAGGWTLDPNALWGGAVASAASYIGATVAGNGQPVTAWSGGVVHVGLNNTPGADQTYQPDCCGAAPQLVTDSATGEVVMAWLSNGHQSGTYVKQVLPTPGALVSLPSGRNEGDFGLTSRIGAPGVFVAYTGGTDQTVRLYNVAHATTQVVTHGAYRVAKAFPAPEGRIWMLWGDANSAVFVTRSNKAVTKWEPVRRIPLPPNLTAFYNAQGEGSAGPLDAFIDLLTGTTNRGFWHAHILPKDSLTYRSAPYPTGGGKSRGSKVEFTVTDAGDPVKGAIIVVARGGKTLLNLRTDANGHASGSLLGNFTGGVRATASAPGYDNAIITVGR